MLGVGIHEDIYLAGATMDDKAVISLTFKEAGKADKVKKSLFEMAASDQVEEVDNGLTVMLFPSTGPKEGDKRTEEKLVEQLTADINKVKGQCLHLLRGYYTSKDLEGKMVPFAGTTLNNDNYNKEIQKKEVLEAVQRNIGRVFVQMVTPFLNKPEEKFRLLLVRQSGDKHFATLRGRYLDDNPFWESMKVPKEQSKLKFNDYEKSNGLDSGIVKVKDSPTSKGNDTAPATTAPVTAANIFGQPQ